MTPDHLQPEEQQEMLDLIWALRDDVLAPDQAARLEQIVCKRPSARRMYYDLMGLLAGVRWELGIADSNTRDGKGGPGVIMFPGIGDLGATPLDAPPTGMQALFARLHFSPK